jgi:uncharacterized protein (DUF983 family)
MVPAVIDGGPAATVTAAIPAHRSTAAMLLSGTRGRCPRCGQGRLFNGFLTIADRCSVCGLGLGGHDAGDGPAVFAIFILGFGICGLAAVVEYLFTPPLWLHAALWLPLTLLGTVALLRPLKGLTVALQYRFRAVDEPERPGAT